MPVHHVFSGSKLWKMLDERDFASALLKLVYLVVAV